MNAKEYAELFWKYDSPLDDEGIKKLLRFWAFQEFDAALEEFCENRKAEWNEGRELDDIGVDEVEAILDRYLERDEEEGTWRRTEMMRNAIQDVTGLIC